MNRRNFNQRKTELTFLRTVRDLEIKKGEEEERAKKTNLSSSNEVYIRCKQIDRARAGLIDRETDRQTDRLTDRQADRQTE